MSSTTYDRASEIKAFNETKAGVKGLVDAGITGVPRFFMHPIEQISASTNEFKIPVIDMKGINTRKQEIVKKVKEASETICFFQVTNLLKVDQSFIARGANKAGDRWKHQL
ncbi:putative isopenicillin N synthase [Dioscorea sansibarensis]